MTDDGADSSCDTAIDNRCMGERQVGADFDDLLGRADDLLEKVPIRAIWLTGSPFSLTRVEPSCMRQRGESLWPMHSTVCPEEQ